MRVLEIAPSDLNGGVHRYVQAILAEAGRQGWEFHLGSPNGEGATTFPGPAGATRVVRHPMEVSQLSLPRFRSYLKALSEVGRTVTLLRKVKPDVVHVNVPWSLQYLNCILACALLRVPTAVVFHLFPETAVFSPRVVRAGAWARSRNQQWIAVSKNNLENISSSLQVPQEEIMCIYNGIVTHVTPAIGSPNGNLRRTVRQELGLPEAAVIALTVGRLDPQKGLDDLIPLIPKLVDEFPDLVFVCAGEGELRDHLVRHVNEYGVAKRILLLGQRSDVVRLMEASDLFVFPSHYEGLPFAILEAMESGLPIVASDSGGTPEVILDKQHGLLARTGDSSSLLYAIRWALAYPAKMREMAANAQVRVKEFSEEKMLARTFEVLDSLSRSNRKRGTLAS